MKFKLIQGIKLMSKFVLYGIVAQLFLLEMLLADGSNAQSVKSVKEVNVSLTVKNVSLEEVFKSVEQQTEFRFTYDIKDVRAVNNVSISLKNASVYDLLENLAKENSFHFRQVNRDIDVKKVGRRSAAKETVEVVLQTISISGRVSSSDTPEGLPGVNVVVKGTAQGTVTDMDGRYTLDVPGSESILVFSSVGYLTEEVVVGGRSVLDMSLTLDVTALEEIVVVGYSEQTRASLTTAVSTVKGKDLINQSTGDVRKALQGTVPGLTIVDQGGAPGQQDVQIRIRGISSVNNTNPLVLVDGMEQQLINVDANAIESVTVLKDAASTAIYGSRGANGVILITTIKGQEGKLRVAYNGFYGTSFPTRRPEAIDTRGYMEMQNLAWANSNNPNVPWPDIDGYLENMRNYPDLYPKAFPGNDEFFNWAPVAKHSVVLSGGSKNIQTMFNLAYEDQASIIPGSHSDRIQLRSNNDFRLNDNIKTFVNISYNRLNSESPNNINQWYYQLMMEPSEFQNQRFPDGTYGFSNRGENIWSMTDHQIMGKRESINDDLVLSTGLEVKFLKNFKYQFSYLANANQDMISANSPRYEIRDYWNENSTVSRRDINDYSEDRDLRIRTTMNSILSYENSWGDHSINVLAGYAEDYFKRTGVYALGRDFYNNEIRNLEQSDPEQRVIRNRFAEWGLRSYFGRASYAYKEKYFVEVNSRYDGSSRFPQGNKYGYFPSASAAWRLSEENFWGSISNVVSDFKLRYSYGITGNQEIGNYTHIPRLVVNNNYAIYNPATGNEEIVTGAGLNDLASTELSWETNTQHNLGIDMSFLDNKLTFSFDVFSRITDGILLDVPIPGVIGLNPAKTNAGVISNKGWESVLTYRGEYRDLKFSVSGNASFVADRIEDFGGLPKQFLFNNRYYREVGSSLYSLNGFIVEGFYRDQDDIDNFPARGNRAGLFPGDLRYRDVSGADGVPDGQINNSDMVDLGYGVPRYFFGLIADVEWKGFDLNMLWQGAAGHHVHLFGKLIESGGYGGWMPAFAAEGYWTGPEDVNARFPVVRQNPGNNIQSSDFWLEKGDYLRLKSLTIGYSLPESIVSRVGIERFRIYANAMNPLTFSRLYRHWQLDPEGRIGSLRYDYFPQVKSYNLGVMLTF